MKRSKPSFIEKMVQESKLLTSPFASFAVEIRQAILCKLPNVKALDAAVSADVHLHDAFHGYAYGILEHVVRHVSRRAGRAGCVTL